MELSIGAGDIYQWSWSYIKSQTADLLQPLKYTQNVKRDSDSHQPSYILLKPSVLPRCLLINRNTASCSPLLVLLEAFTGLCLTPPLTLTTKKELTITIQNLLKLDLSIVKDIKLDVIRQIKGLPAGLWEPLSVRCFSFILS